MSKIGASKIMVGLSGGVDSSLSAYLLKEAGSDVHAGFIKVWQPDFLPCSQEQDRKDAIKVAAHLDVPCSTIDLADTYKREVVDYMISAYRAGKTPNPDVLCNKEVKFGAFLSHALLKGFDAVATGHYAQRRLNTSTDEYELHRSVDENKDQTYFLWTLTQAQLSHIMFPIGHMTKDAVREMAAAVHLPSAARKDSQGLCFVGHIDLKEFLSHFVTATQGVVVNQHGEEIGTHDGAPFYTVGQRHGFTAKTHSHNQQPYFVVSKDVEKNILVVSDEVGYLTPQYDHHKISITEANWINATPSVGDTLQARLRHRQTLFPCTIDSVTKESATVSLETPIPHIPEGQALVLYDNTRCVGGGFIVH